MSDVAKKLREATCEAAPYGWSEYDSDGNLITDFYPLCDGWFAGRTGGRWMCMWSSCGFALSFENSKRTGNLVPLPAPEPERLTDDKTPPERLEQIEHYNSGEVAFLDSTDSSESQRRMYRTLYLERLQLARELQQARKTIAEQAEQIETLRTMNHSQENSILNMRKCEHEVRDKLTSQSAEIERLTELINAFEKSALQRIRERDAAIELARRMNSPIVDERRAACIEANAKYGFQIKSDPPPTCDHEWRHDEDLGYRQKCCDKCGKIAELCRECDEVECRCNQLPTCEPISPANEAIEYLRSPRYPGLIFGQIVSTGGTVECAKLWIDPACVESGPWQGQSGAVWRAI